MSAAPLAVDDVLRCGLAIADQLVERAIWAGDEACTFAGATAPSAIGEPVPYITVGPDVYEGTAGVARFLFLAARCSGDSSHERTAAGALRHAIFLAEGMSLFSGKLGVGLTALECGGPAFFEAGVRLVNEAIDIADSHGDELAADLLGGLAGMVVGLDYALDAVDCLRWSQAMIDFGHRLVKSATVAEMGLSWPVYPGSTDHLCGLAHGASSVALAMQALDRRRADAGPWLATAQQAREFERMHYWPQYGSWADLRSDVDAATAPGVEAQFGPDDGVVCPHMWCHGSIGIAAERLTADPSDAFAAADRVAGLEGLRMSTEAAIASPRGVDGTHLINGSQCHGLGGAIDVLLDAALIADDPAPWFELACRAAEVIRDDAAQAGAWRCGVPNGGEAPGLMLGLAGIGWAMLRLANPAHVPSAWRIGQALRPRAHSISDVPR